MAYRAGEVEVLLNVDDRDVARAEKNIKATGERIEKNPVTKKVDADTKDAVAGMDRVEESAKRLVSERAVLKLDADIESAEKRLDSTKNRLEDLQLRAAGGLNVDADTKRAEAQIRRLEGTLQGLRSARTQVEIDADTSAAENALDDLADNAEEAGNDGGKRSGRALVTGIVAGLASIPIVGAVAQVGHTIADNLVSEFQSALQVEVRQDRLQALTGIDEASASRFARAAGEAYANNFGESIESNMNTTRLALQFRIIDPDATARDTQRVVENLGGIADVLEEDVSRAATTVTTLLKTGMAASADEAFDILATGAREGVNRAEDMLDTFTEYPSVLQRLGLSGKEMLGLINQGLTAGARNSDIAADALKEFQIRATDASELSAQGFEILGLNAEEMTARIAAGGESAREGLDVVLDRLRSMEDPVARNAAAVALFGTQAEDLGEALFAMDLSTAVDQLNGVEGAARRMFDTLADNDSNRIERAQRNIEVAADGIKGALASAFADPLGEAADWISQNRGPVLQFFLDLANGALDFGESVVEGLAAGTEGVGQFVAGPLADLTKGLAGFVGFFDKEAGEGLDDLVEEMRGFDETTQSAADTMRTEMGNALDIAREKLNQFGEPAVAMGFLNDASLRLADAVAGVGYAADGSRIGLEGIDLANIRASESGRLLEDQVRSAVAALGDEISAASAAGESQEELAGRYNTATSALVSQLTQMGLTEDQARALIDTVLQTPESATTEFSSNAQAEQGKVQSLADRIITLPDGTVTIDADTGPARAGLEGFIMGANGRRINVYVDAVGGRTYQVQGSNVRFNAQGGVLEFMANGGIPGLTPMSSLADIVPANTWRVVGDRGDVPELYAPLDGSARSWALLLEGIRRMPGGPEGLAGAAAPSGPGPSGMPPIQVIHNGDNYAYDPRDIEREQRLGLTRALDALPPS
ncbi:phage tail tape measure protein [Microbacterium trichothecenolyticum]